jgi:hypothetical protein
MQRELAAVPSVMRTVLSGDVVWLTDDSIPNYGTTSNTQIIVSSTAMMLAEGEAITSVFTETVAAELRVPHDSLRRSETRAPQPVLVRAGCRSAVRRGAACLGSVKRGLAAPAHRVVA